MWNSHHEFKDIIRGAWRENILHDAIAEFTVKAKKWNKDVFGNIFAKKKRLMARLIGIALANCSKAFLLNLQNQLTEEFNQLL